MLWTVVFATAPGNLTLHTSDNTAQSFPVKAGVNKISTPLTPGGYMRGVLQRSGQTVIDLQPKGYTFNANPDAYNYNAFTAFATSQGSSSSTNAPANNTSS